jgi:Zn-dependent protease
MRATFRLGRVAGIPIGVHWSLLVVAALLTTSLAGSMLPSVLPNAEGSYWAAAVLAALLFFMSILAHELSHALVARHYGQKVEDITLWVLGGVARLGSEAPSPRAEALVALAGPGTSIALGGMFIAAGSFVRAITPSDTLLAVVLVWLGAINLLLAVFNLLPGAPLDGGRVVSAFLWKRHGDRRRGQIGAARAGRVVGGLLIGLGLANFLFGVGFGTLWTVLVGWFITEASKAEEQAARAGRALDGRTVGELMAPPPPEVPEWSTVGGVRSSVPDPGATHRVIALRGLDGSVRSVVTVDDVRRLPAEVPVRNIARPVLVASPEANVMDVLHDAGPAGAIVVMDGARVLGVIGRDEIAGARRDDDRVDARSV